MFCFDSKFCWFVILWTIWVFESWQLLPIRGGAGRCLAAVCTSRVVGSPGLVGLVGPSGSDSNRSFDRESSLQPGARPVRGFDGETGTEVGDRMVESGFNESIRWDSDSDSVLGVRQRSWPSCSQTSRSRPLSSPVQITFRFFFLQFFSVFFFFLTGF